MGDCGGMCAGVGRRSNGFLDAMVYFKLVIPYIFVVSEVGFSLGFWH